MNLNGVEYFYIRNAQGDIIGLFDKTGIAQTIKPYANLAKKVSKALTVVSAGMDLVGTWDATTKMSLGQKKAKQRFN